MRGYPVNDEHVIAIATDSLLGLINEEIVCDPNDIIMGAVAAWDHHVDNTPDQLTLQRWYAERLLTLHYEELLSMCSRRCIPLDMLQHEISTSCANQALRMSEALSDIYGGLLRGYIEKGWFIRGVYIDTTSCLISIKSATYPVGGLLYRLSSAYCEGTGTTNVFSHMGR